MTEQEQHERELVDLHEGWKNRERELLARIERLESALQAVKDWDIKNFMSSGNFLVPEDIRKQIQAAYMAQQADKGE